MPQPPPNPGIVGVNMMNNTQWPMIFSQLAGQAPTLLVYLVGLVLAGVWWRRAPKAALFAMMGCGILLLTTVGTTFGYAYVVNTRGAGPTPATTISQIMFVIAIVGSVLRAAGIALLLAGVFAGRPRLAEMSGFEVQPMR